jgi:NADH-quinone oxidoreductase subunit N
MIAPALSMAPTMAMTELNMAPASAEIWLASATCVVLLMGVLFGERHRWLVPILSILTLAGAAWMTVTHGAAERIVTLNGFFVADPMGDVLKLFSYGAVAVSFLYARDYLERRNLHKSEYYVLSLFALLGVMVMISANSLLTIYLGVELLSLSLYALVAFDRDSGVAAESAMKYFVLGAIASGTLLYGMSMIYGVTGSLQLDHIALAVHGLGASHIGLIFGLVFLIAGVAFKFGAVPFHMWVPDVYHGAPTPITAFIGSVPKIASFVLAIRLLVEGLGEMSASWQQLLIVMAVLSMGVGNVVAIAQVNIKRMLAYSTISHVGFILLGIIAGTSQGYQASMYYTLTYVIMALGSFGMILLLARKDFEGDRIDDFRGLAKKSPWSAAIMLMLMMSTAGVPPFIGFWAKLEVLRAILNVGYLWLAGASVLFSVIGAYYYLRIVKVMYFDAPEDNVPIEASSAMRLVLSANGLAVLVLGIFPSVLLDVCVKALS